MGESRRRKTPPSAARSARPARPAAQPPRARPAPPHTGAALRWSAPSPRIEAWFSAAWVLPSILALGLALRLVHQVALAGSPFFDSLVLDARYYDAWARDIAGGAWIGKAAFWVDPLYAYLLGIIYRVAGHNLLWTRILNVACGLATAWLTAQIARRVWQSRAAAALAALAAVTFVPAFYFEGQSEKTAVTLVLVTAAVALFLRTSTRAVLAAGIVTGLATLARGNALLFAPFAVACLLLGWDRMAEDGAPLPQRARQTRAALFLLGMLPVVALATLHNWLAVHELVPTTTNLGVNLYLGNHSGNDYGFYEPPDFLRPETGDELPDFRAEAQRRTGREMTDAQLSSYWQGQALSEMAANPGLSLLRTVRKAYLTLNDTEIPDNEDVSMVAHWSPVLHAPLLWMGELVPLALLGAVVGWRRRGVRIVVAIAAVYLASLLPFFVMSRLRIQMVPLLCVLAGGALVWLIDVARQRRTRSLWAALAVLLPAAALAYYQTPTLAHRRASGLAIAWNNLGSSFAHDGQPQQAINAYQQAIATDVAAVPASLRAVADLYRQQGDLSHAESALRQLVEVRPQSQSARAALNQLYTQMLSDPRWSNDAAFRARAQHVGSAAPAPAAAAAPPAAPADPVAAAMAQARTLARAGHTDDAIRVMQDAVRKGPYDENLHYMLGETMAKHAKPDELVQFFSSEVAHDEKPQTSHYYWAIGLANGGDIPAAIAQLQEALAIDPAHEVSQREWGLLLEQQGQPDAALEHLLEATRIHPDFKAAWDDAARIAAANGRGAEAETYRQRAAAADPNSDRRYLHWARYLHEHQRDRAAWVELQHWLDGHSSDAEGLALREQIRPNLDAATLAALSAPPTPVAAGPAIATASGLDATARATLQARLQQQPGSTAWISYDGRDAGAQALANDLVATFRTAGWQVADAGPVSFPLRPGLFVFVADQPSAATQAVTEGLTAGGLTHTFASEYRSYSDERRRADPNWRGVSFAPQQEFAIVVGRRG